MGFRNSIARILGLQREAAGNTTAGNTTTNSPRRGYPYVPPPSLPLAVGTVYRCVNVIADIVSRLPVECLKRRGDIFTDDYSNPLHYLLNDEPCPWMSAFDMKRQAIAQILLQGNAYIVPVISPVKMAVSDLILAGPGTVTHDLTTDTYKVYDKVNGLCGTFDEDEIIHLKNFSLDGKTGISTLHYARTCIEIALHGDAETLKRFTTGGTVRGILSRDSGVIGVGEYQDTELDKLATDINSRFISGENIVATHGQTKLDIISMTSADMQFLESRKFQVLDICRFFGVPPFFVFSDTSNNYKSTEMAELSFYSDTLAPLITKLEKELNRKLIGRTGYGRRKIRFDVTQMHPMDNAGRTNYLKTMLECGATVNEVRKISNLPPLEGCDKPMVTANVKSVENLVNEGQQNQSSNENDDKKEPLPE